MYKAPVPTAYVGRQTVIHPLRQQYIIFLGNLDVGTARMTMSGARLAWQSMSCFRSLHVDRHLTKMWNAENKQGRFNLFGPHQEGGSTRRGLALCWNLRLFPSYVRTYLMHQP